MAHRTQVTIQFDDAPRPADIAAVRAGLLAFNESKVGKANVQPIAFFVRDASEKIVGGLTGYLAFDWLYVDLLWLDDSLRGQGYGAALLADAERFARASGCTDARLDTYEFQARGFYEHLGYAVYGVLEDYPAGTRTYHMSKHL